MLHVLTGADCNNSCIFCMEADRAARRRAVLAQTPADLRAAIRGYPARDHVLFTSGEPTLNDALPDLVGEAAAAGFHTVALITNGRRLAYTAYTELLLRRGLNRVTVSIHGPDAVVHDGLTGVRGSFDQTLRGLRNLAAARPARRLELHTSSVVVRRNLPHLAALRHLLEELAVDRMCFNVMMAKGRGLERLETLMPRYRDVAGTFRALVAPLSVEARRRVSLADIPRCCVRGIPVEVVGEQERFQQFERTDSLGVSGIAHEDLGARAAGDGPDRDAARRLLERSAAADLAGDGRYYLTTRELKDGLLRTRRDLCSECRYDAVCPGVWTAYTEAWGWDEFEPVRPAAGVPEKGA